MLIEHRNPTPQVITFGELAIGSVFTVRGANGVYLKINDCAMAQTDENGNNIVANAVNLEENALQVCDASFPVYDLNGMVIVD